MPKPAIYNDEVRQTYEDFTGLVDFRSVLLIGGTALGAYLPARNTFDIDFAVRSKEDIDSIAIKVASKFRRHRTSAIEHRKTGVEVEFVYPELVGLNPKLLELAFSEARGDGGVLVASPKFLIALKLGRACGSNSRAMIDRGDILGLSEAFGKQDLSDLEGLLKPSEIAFYDKLCLEAGI